MNLIWRFYKDSNLGWKWQHISADRTVVAESRTGYKEYEECMADAKGNGYVFLPSQPKTISSAPHRFYAK